MATRDRDILYNWAKKCRHLRSYIVPEIDALNDKLKNLYETIDFAFNIIPENLRPSKPEDIFVGNRVFLKTEFRYKAMIVCEVLYPDDDWKAFVADDTSRYGHHHLFAEDKANDKK